MTLSMQDQRVRSSSSISVKSGTECSTSDRLYFRHRDSDTGGKAGEECCDRIATANARYIDGTGYFEPRTERNRFEQNVPRRNGQVHEMCSSPSLIARLILYTLALFSSSCSQHFKESSAVQQCSSSDAVKEYNVSCISARANISRRCIVVEYGDHQS